MEVLEWGHVCHCRMCQRATGGLFAALVGAPKDKFRWLTEEAPVFWSSNLASRAFCPACGTPLGFTYDRPASMQYVTIGSLDHPEAVELTEQFGIESKLPFVQFCEDLPMKRTGDGQSAEGLAFLAKMQKQQSTGE
jgi:hypothetical protein